mmetsp:Transcript_24587/g.68439  ORF Transcript_24587/g.68439 Transcript_24587/m.68439 type:complete len:237 (+) Transcript_24587:1418-2128(+)
MYGQKMGPGLDTLGHPYAHLMAALVVAARLAWGLGSGQAAVSHLAQALGPEDWQKWAARLYQRMDRPVPIPTTVRQALELPKDEWEDYMQYCKSVVFADLAVPQELKKLDSIVRSASNHLKDCSDNHDYGLAAGEYLDMPLQRHGAIVSAARHPQDTAPPVETRPLDGDTPCSDGAYIAFWKSRDKSGCVPPDYAALLLTASRLIWVKTAELHRLVVHLEQRCRDVELLIERRTQL